MTDYAGTQLPDYYTGYKYEDLLRLLAKRMNWPPSSIRALTEHPIDLIRLADILTKLDQFEKAAM